ncbi:SLC13 family permease [Desulfoscipio gibsoniae]|uniref:Di-/tricarboxylate transporter n=1 Tax=Desulfoscipio gibsoniae DSM 7213 TaxID=767817 RepID=R4KBY8_9FIRM|nr:SLC13 family permease [Desulfoscipio gibsoniae]AGL00074.1 di-/tricarboxylate transporter [Desulfoscipio gibsoniae DSM 7213]
MSGTGTSTKVKTPTKQGPPNLKLVCALLSVIAGIAIALIPPPDGLSVQAMHALGIMLGAILFWVFNILPEHVTGILMCTLWVIVGAVPFQKAFAAYSTDTPWLLIPAFAIGIAAQKAGLLKRVALNVMKVFPPTFKGQTLALLSAGTIISPAIPSVTAKAVFASQLTKAIGDRMEYEEKSAGAAGLYAAMYQGFVTMFPLFLTAGIFSIIMRSCLPTEIQAQFTWVNWLWSALPWGIAVFIGSYLAIQFLYKPEQKQELSKEYFITQLKELGPMNRDEKIIAVIVACCLLLWMTEKIHHLTAAQVALLALVALFVFKILSTSDFRTKIPWEMIVFIGGVMALGSVITFLEIDTWMGTVLGPVITPLIGNMFIFAPLLAIAIYLIRFVLVAQSSTVMIFTVMLTPFALQVGVNPWIVGLIILTSANVWTVKYQNTTHIAAMSATGNEFIKQSQAAKMSIAYMLINIIAIVVSLPWWKMLGLIP